VLGAHREARTRYSKEPTVFLIRLTTITLRHFDAGERAPSTTPFADMFIS
jgi:hypothetical protein